ncbi:MAG: hypothetical protein MR278_01635 [Bacteroidales bacterium]|nr:hypothetical protein [Anaerotignum sp.]MCI5678676.1 hypothetical protein [Bacteroidales bacterium]MDY3925965.1 hypothetical protein [Anaerotignum sp.]
MDKYSTDQVKSRFFECMLCIAEEIGKQKDIFETEPSQKDCDQLFFYAQALFEVHNLTHGEYFDSDFFDSCTDKFYEMVKDRLSVSEAFEWSDYSHESIAYFEKIHIEFLKGSSEQDSLMHYVSAILSRLESCNGTGAFSFSGIALASLLPEFFEYIGANYDLMVSLWDKTKDTAEKPSVQSNDNFIVETYQEKTTQSSTTQPQKKNESAENKKMRTIFLILVLIGCFAASIYFYTENTASEKEIKHLEFLLSQAEYREKNKEETIKQYKTRIDSMSDEYEFYHKYAVIVTETGYRYHSYGCPHIEGRSFWIYNIAAAKSEGYTPCLDCNPPQ